MNVYMETDDWLGCPTPLEMYQHQCSLLEDELVETERMLRRARANVAGLVQMNELLANGKAEAEKALKDALDRISEMGGDLSGRSHYQAIDIIRDQRDHLFRENQRMAMELLVYKQPLA